MRPNPPVPINIGPRAHDVRLGRGSAGRGGRVPARARAPWCPHYSYSLVRSETYNGRGNHRGAVEAPAVFSRPPV